MSLKYFRQSHVSNGPNIPYESSYLTSLILIISTLGESLATNKRSQVVVSSNVVS